MVDEETFRALARSSPWLWSSVRFTRTTSGRRDDERLRAWLQRPARMRVEPEHGPVHSVDERDQVGNDRGLFRAVSTVDGGAGLPEAYVEDERDQSARGWATYSATANTTVGAARAEGLRDLVFRFPQDPGAPAPARREDGLVVRRPDDFAVVYDDPMYVNYLWVAMLDPRELADGVEPDDVPDEPGSTGVRSGDAEGGGWGARPPGVEILELERGELFGRAVLQAAVRPAPAYDPRCACCPLLYSEVSVAIDREEGASEPEPMPAFAGRYEVVLDVETGIVVRLRDVGGDRDGVGFDVVIEEVDASYPDEMFREARVTHARQPDGGEPQPSRYPS